MSPHSPKSASRRKISVVIPVFNGGHGFVRCLNSLRQSQRQPDEVIVVADGDTDGSWQVAEAFGAKVFRYPAAGGPARARNRGARMAKGDILLFLDADVTVHTDTIALVEKAFQNDLDLVALIGSYDDAPGAENFLSQYKNLFHHYTHQISSETASTFWGACGAIRHPVFHAIGGFDEAYSKPCIEDIELGYRLQRAGHKIRLCKNIQVKHLKCWRPMGLLKAEIFYRALPWTDLILSDRQFNADLNLSHANRMSVVLTFALIASLLTSAFLPQSLLISGFLSLALLLINWPVYQFFYRKQGLLFALRVIPWHWLYFLYGGMSFAYGLCGHYLGRLNLPELPMPIGVYKSR